MTKSGTAEEPSPPAPWRCLHEVFEQMLIGTRVALIGGAVIGSSAAVYLLTGHYSELMQATWASGLTAFLHLLSLCALVATAALLPIEVLLGAALCFSFRLRARVAPRRFYATTLGIGLLAVVGFLYVAFNQVRDLKTPLGAATVATFVLVPPLAVFLLNLRPPSTRRRPGRPRLSVALWTLSLLSVLGLTFSATRIPLSRARRSNAPAAAAAESTSSPQHAPTSAVGPGGPAVLLVSIDTLRADHLGAYGYHRPTTPHLDAFATEAALFERAYSPTSWTLPSHATMLTGLYPTHHGVRFTDNIRFLNSRSTDVLSGANVTLAEILGANGYSTAGFTSCHWLSSAFGFDQGFDVLESSGAEHTAEALVDKVTRWLDHLGNEPFFLFLHYFDVHEYRSPAEYFRRFHADDYSGQVAGQELKTMGNLWQRLSADDLTYIEGKYDGALSYVDAELGRLLAHLKSLGRFDEALIIVTSDHGEEFLDHGATGHGMTLYEEQLRIPLLLKPPRGDGAPLRIESPAALVDLVPTVLDYAGLVAIVASDGVSLRPLIRGQAAEARSLHFGDVFYQNRAAILEGDHKFIANRLPPLEPFRWQRSLTNLRTFFKFGEDELYDLATDPEERRNLFSTHSEVAARLRDRLLEHQRTSRSGPVKTMDAETVERLRALGYLD